MIHEILVCLEGSPASARAGAFAIAIAQRLGASLVGLAVVDEPDILAAEAVGIGGSSYKHQRDLVLLADARARTHQWMDAFVSRCQESGAPVRRLELRGRPAEVIVEEMQRHDLTVVGRSVNFRFETDERDRTRDQVLRRAGKPVLIVPDQPISSGNAVAIAFDGSPAAERALRSFAVGGLARQVRLHVVTVGDDGAAAWDTARRGCVMLSELGLPAKPHKIVSLQSIPDAILELRAKLDAGMLVIGGYVPSRVTRFFWGSVTHALVEKSPVPVFIHY